MLSPHLGHQVRRGKGPMVISAEINQSKRVESISLPCLTGLHEQINFLSFSPAAFSRGICLSGNLHLSPDRLPLTKRCGDEKGERGKKTPIRLSVLPGKPVRNMKKEFYFDVRRHVFQNNIKSLKKRRLN